MTESDRSKTCARCGSNVQAGDRFCETCGVRVPPDAQGASPTGEVPTLVQPPPVVPTRRGNRTRILAVAFGVLLIFLLGGAAAMALNGLGSDSDLLGGQEPSPPSPPTPGAPSGTPGPSTSQTATPDPSARDEETVYGADGTDPDAEDTATRGPENNQPDSSQQEAEEQARAAAVAYYHAADARNWEYTYEHLDSQTQGAYSEQEWFAKNDYLADTGEVTYTIESVVMDPAAPETVANVTVVVTATSDGSTNVRNTYWVYEDGMWLHRFGPEEHELFANAPSGSASASAQ